MGKHADQGLSYRFVFRHPGTDFIILTNMTDRLRWGKPNHPYSTWFLGKRLSPAPINA